MGNLLSSAIIEKYLPILYISLECYKFMINPYPVYKFIQLSFV